MATGTLNKDYLEDVLAQIESSVCVVDRDRKIVYVNNLGKQRLFHGQDLDKPSMYEVFPNLTYETSVIERVFATGKPQMNQICSWADMRGEHHISMISVFPIMADNEVVAVCEAAEPLDGLSSESKDFLNNKLPHINEILKGGFKQDESYYTIDDIVGDSDAIRSLKHRILLAIRSPANLLIYGETGTGKEMIAQSVYSSYKKHDMPFIAQNCAAIPESLLESSLFGTVKGSFTGAETRPGLFELANKGILFLDEINSMSAGLQAKVLRAIQERMVRRVGGLKEVPLDFRLVTATNTRPNKLLAEGTLRRDFFYRISVMYLEAPALRERREDIPLLTKRFIDEFNATYNKNIAGFDQRSMTFFMEYDWPGNVRELKHVVERSVSICSKKVIPFDRDIMFPFAEDEIALGKAPLPELSHDTAVWIGESLKQSLANFEISLLKRAIEQSGGNLVKAAQVLDVPPQTLQNKLAKYGLREFVRIAKEGPPKTQ